MELLSNEIEHLNYNGTFLNGKQTAEALGVSPPTLSEAVKYGYNCGGYPVEEWVIHSDSGRVKGYYVPEFLVSGDYQERKTRNNPNRESNITSEKSKEPGTENITTINHNNYSLLPEGQDYTKPVGMMALSSPLENALEKDTPQSRVVIGSIVAVLGAITGHTVSDNKTIGATIGASLGLGIALLLYHSGNLEQNTYEQIADTSSANQNSDSNHVSKNFNGTMSKIELNKL